MTILSVSGWAARLPHHASDKMAAFRTQPNLRGCESDTEIWVRGELSPEELPQQVRRTTGAELFTVTTEDELIPWGCLVPVGILPKGSWIPLAELLTPKFPTAGFAPRQHPACELQLIRSDQAQAPSAIEIELATWAKFVCQAPQVRLSRWEFAAASSGRVLVRGLPLPALPGRRYWDSEGLLIPVGYRWFPEVDAHVIRGIMQLLPEEIALWSADPTQWERISVEAFVPARRENVHQTVLERTETKERSS